MNFVPELVAWAVMLMASATGALLICCGIAVMAGAFRTAVPTVPRRRAAAVEVTPQAKADPFPPLVECTCAEPSEPLHIEVFDTPTGEPRVARVVCTNCWDLARECACVSDAAAEKAAEEKAKAAANMAAGRGEHRHAPGTLVFSGDDSGPIVVLCDCGVVLPQR